MGVPGALAASSTPCRPRPARGQDGDGLVAVLVGRTTADRVVPGQLGHPGVVQDQRSTRIACSRVLKTLAPVRVPLRSCS
jgi:hypothetical protein